jgi:hypothetical protein
LFHVFTVLWSFVFVSEQRSRGSFLIWLVRIA